jgi:hypothetical protein
VLSATSGAFAFNGFSVDLKYSAATPAYTLVALPGAFPFAGSSVNFLYGYRLTATVGAFAFAGVTTGLVYGRTLVATTANFAFNGISADLTYRAVYKISVDAGAFPFTGFNVDLAYHALQNYQLIVTPGIFDFSTLPVNLSAILFEKQPGDIRFGRRVYLRRW